MANSVDTETTPQYDSPSNRELGTAFRHLPDVAINSLNTLLESYSHPVNADIGSYLDGIKNGPSNEERFLTYLAACSARGASILSFFEHMAKTAIALESVGRTEDALEMMRYSIDNHWGLRKSAIEQDGAINPNVADTSEDFLVAQYEALARLHQQTGYSAHFH